MDGPRAAGQQGAGTCQLQLLDGGDAAGVDRPDGEHERQHEQELPQPLQPQPPLLEGRPAADPTDPTDPDPDATTHAFQAETRRLLDIVTNSLYTDKEVFVRELVSNASDALEKCRHAHLAKGEDPGELVVAIDVDDEKRTFTISDNGLGMTADELRENLGTIARSGTLEFLKRAGEGEEASPDLIGQFGVGFYASFMVADEVDVVSRRAG